MTLIEYSVDTLVSLHRGQQGEQAVAGVGISILWALCRHLIDITNAQ